VRDGLSKRGGEIDRGQGRTSSSTRGGDGLSPWFSELVGRGRERGVERSSTPVVGGGLENRDSLFGDVRRKGGGTGPQVRGCQSNHIIHKHPDLRGKGGAAKADWGS